MASVERGTTRILSAERQAHWRKEQLLIWHSDALESLNPKDGAVYWSVQIKPTYAMSIGQPVVEGNRVYVMGYNRVSACVEVAGDGETAK